MHRLLACASLAAAMRVQPHLPRRAVLDVRVECRGFRHAAGARRSRTAAAPGKSVGAMQKLKSGVRYIDLKEGSGASVSSGSRVSLQWVLRRSNGYFVTSSFGQVASGPDAGILKLSGTSVNDPFLFTVGSGAALPGLEEAVLGMKKGGVRRIVPRACRIRSRSNRAPAPCPRTTARGGRSSASSRRWTPRTSSSSRSRP